MGHGPISKSRPRVQMTFEPARTHASTPLCAFYSLCRLPVLLPLVAGGPTCDFTAQQVEGSETVRCCKHANSRPTQVPRNGFRISRTSHSDHRQIPSLTCTEHLTPYRSKAHYYCRCPSIAQLSMKPAAQRRRPAPAISVSPI